MSDELQAVSIQQFGGLNVRDPSLDLLPRSFQGGQQVSPVESPYCLNVDFIAEGVRQRLGSILYGDLTSLLVNGETLLKGTEFVQGYTHTACRVIIGTKRIYTDQSGSWASLFGSTTCNGTSTSGQPVLTVNATTAFAVGQYVKINNDANAYKILSIVAGVSLTMTTNLLSNYTNTQTVVRVFDTVSKCSFCKLDGKLFIGTDGDNCIQVYRTGSTLDAEGKSGNVYYLTGTADPQYTGTWPTGAWMLAAFQSRLCWSIGQRYVEYTGTTPTGDPAPWALIAGTNPGSSLVDGVGGVAITAGEIIGLRAFTPMMGNAMNELLYAFTSSGAEFLTGFGLSDAYQRIDGVGAVVNNDCVVGVKGWLVVLTQDKRILAINGAQVTDLGRRLWALDGSGPLGDISITYAKTTAWGCYNKVKEQVVFGIPRGAATTNTSAILIDFKLGEPYYGEPMHSAERHIRCVPWTWPAYVEMFIVSPARPMVIKSTGKIFEMEQGLSDEASATAISSAWKTPGIAVPVIALKKNWLTLTLRSYPTGTWNVSCNIYKALNTQIVQTFSFSQGYAGSGESVVGTAHVGTATVASLQLVTGYSDLNMYEEVIQWDITNAVIDTTWILMAGELSFLPGAQER